MLCSPAGRWYVALFPPQNDPDFTAFDRSVVQVIDVIHPGRANVPKAELQEKIAEVTPRPRVSFVSLFASSLARRTDSRLCVMCCCGCSLRAFCACVVAWFLWGLRRVVSCVWMWFFLWG
jgi:hypothetical protein